MSNIIQLIEWGNNVLVSKGKLLEHAPQVIIETPWSTVIRFSTSDDYFYLKQTPADLFIETEIIKVIQKNNPDSPTPIIISENKAFNCYLMESCGTHSLRTKFNGVIDVELLGKGLNAYFSIVRSFEQNLDALEAIGVPDWRLNRLPQLLVAFLDKEDLLLEEGLTADEIDKLKKLVPTIESICDYLSKQKVKETVINADFNENNLIINDNTQQISIVDWGECVITHPFFSIGAHLQSLSRRYKLELEGPLWQDIKQKCVAHWFDVADINELDAIFQQTQRLLPIFSTLASYRLQTATHNKSKEKQTWFIGPILRTLLAQDVNSEMPK